MIMLTAHGVHVSYGVAVLNDVVIAGIFLTILVFTVAGTRRYRKRVTRELRAEMATDLRAIVAEAKLDEDAATITAAVKRIEALALWVEDNAIPSDVEPAEVLREAMEHTI